MNSEQKSSDSDGENPSEDLNRAFVCSKCGDTIDGEYARLEVTHRWTERDDEKSYHNACIGCAKAILQEGEL